MAEEVPITKLPQVEKGEMTLGYYMKNIAGRSQTWLRTEMKKQGIKRDKATINQWCKNIHAPKNKYLYRVLAELLETNETTIRNMFFEETMKF